MRPSGPKTDCIIDAKPAFFKSICPALNNRWFGRKDDGIEKLLSIRCRQLVRSKVGCNKRVTSHSGHPNSSVPGANSKLYFAASVAAKGYVAFRRNCHRVGEVIRG